jgi:hypothetical protein
MHIILSNKYAKENTKMSEFLNSLGRGFATFQDTFGSGQLNNGAALVRQAANGKINGGNFRIGFASLGTESSINNRVFIRIPKEYFLDGTKLLALSDDKRNGWGGIYFPVTPSIRQDVKANWQPTNVQHTNYAIYSYTNSDVGPISLSGQFPVQTQQEAFSWLATITALRALTKMRTGNDVIPGAPPPVCRFYAYGPDIYSGVPVVIGSFSIDLPADVDYLTGFNIEGYETKVPVLSTINMTLFPVYSRKELSRFGVDSFVRGDRGMEGFI